MNILRPTTHLQLLGHRTGLAQQCRNTPHPFSTPIGQLRHWFGWGRKKKEEEGPPSSKSDSRSLKELLKASPKSGASDVNIPTFERGKLASTSLFSDEGAEVTPGTSATSVSTTSDADYLAIVDPHRTTSWSWPRRFEASQYRRRGRLTRRMRILQTERFHTKKSHWIKTSIKKLAPLARQIAGLNLNDAIVQMRFSPKKASQDILGLLGEARLEAIVRRGMKDQEIYVSEAWVGRGTFERELNHRARGRVDILKKPYTSITVVLKEQATRDRIAKEKTEKKARQKVWVQLPNRPIYGQQQYYQW